MTPEPKLTDELPRTDLLAVQYRDIGPAAVRAAVLSAPRPQIKVWKKKKLTVVEVTD
ncbi:MAG: hypothetical protein ACRECW_14565 [Phyllobacterium sp.]